MAREAEGQVDSDDPGADVTDLVSYEPDGAIFSDIFGEVRRLVAHRLYLDMEEGSKRELGAVPVERSTRRIEYF